MLIEAIIFDKDGVLADSEKLKAQAWERALQPYGVDQGFDWYLENFGPSPVALSEMAIAAFRFHADAQEVANAWRTEYCAIEHSAEPITTNLQCLQRLARKYPIAVASSMDKAAIESEMERFGYLHHISICVSGEDVPNNKPAPDVYLAAATALNVTPSSCVAIEDSPTGISAAKAAGMLCIGYRNPLYCLDLSAADISTTDLYTVTLLWQ
ncbi:MAG: HAD family phosphatase [Deltaproteobacteria bacterium]|nr:HAD family phosphatase [Deltaproteobacteria bacterium]